MTINKATTAINEACIGWLHENFYLVRRIFLVWEMSIFCAVGGDSPSPSLSAPPHTHTPSQGFSETAGLEEGVEQFIHGGSNKQDESRWKLFGKMGNTGSIIQEDNSA